MAHIVTTNLEPVVKDSQNTIDNMLLNLKILSELEEGDKLIAGGNTLEIDKTWVLQGIVRWYNNSSREGTLAKIEELFREIFTFIDTTIKNERRSRGRRREIFDQDISQLLQKFFVAIQNAISGIENLRATYKTDITIRSRLTLLIDMLKTRIEDLNKILRLDISSESAQPASS